MQLVAENGGWQAEAVAVAVVIVATEWRWGSVAICSGGDKSGWWQWLVSDRQRQCW